jgi:hypothetical protein
MNITGLAYRLCYTCTMSGSPSLVPRELHEDFKVSILVHPSTLKALAFVRQ